MSEIVVDAIETDGPRLTCAVTPSRDLRRYFTGRDFSVEYGRDVEDVPASIAAIPALAQVCPVAWANGADVHVPVLDRRFHRALGAVRDALASMYPEFVTGGAVYAGRLTVPDVSPDAFDASALLFSGGVDSTATYVRHREEEPALVSVQGWVVDSEDEAGWERTRRHLAAFAGTRGLDHHAIRSNMLRVLDTPMLQASYQRYLEGAWYSSVGHGLGLLGLCAPLAHAAGIGRLYIAATHWTGAEIRWGSCPAIDDRVRWTGTTAEHDGYELTRQERVELIADYVRSGHGDLELRTCNVEPAGNCGRCEKCARTIVGLLLAGLDPADHGYPVDDDLFAHVRERFESGDWVLSRDELLMWRDLRDHVPADVTVDSPTGGVELPSAPDEPAAWTDPAFVAFLEWLADADLAAVVARSRPSLRHRLVQTVARNTPNRVYERVYPVYASLR